MILLKIIVIFRDRGAGGVPLFQASDNRKNNPLRSPPALIPYALPRPLSPALSPGPYPLRSPPALIPCGKSAAVQVYPLN